MAATGTDGQPIGDRFALHLPYAGDAPGRDLAVIGGNDDVSTESPDVVSMSRNPVEIPEVDASCRVVSYPDVEYRRWESNPHGGSPPEDFKSSASALPPRRQIRMPRQLQGRMTLIRPDLGLTH
jgi:hypothetical protein